MFINTVLSQLKRRFYLKLIKSFPNEIFVNRKAAIIYHGPDQFEIEEGNFLEMNDMQINALFNKQNLVVNRANFR